MKAVFLAVLFLVIGGIISSSVNSSLNVWYNSLNKPFLNPPNFVFMPIWTLLYISLAVFIWMIDRQPQNPLVIQAKKLFVWQLVLNFLWTPIFFGMQNILAGLIVLLIIDFLVFRLINISYQISKVATLIILPYFCWLLFATYLNTSLFLIN